MSRKLVLYFSVYGTTKIIAETVAMQINADISAIESAVPYDTDRNHYELLARRAKKEHDENMHPKIKSKININDYDVIFIGYPIWWYTLPMILYTLFETYDFSDKVIIPFNTHLGSRDGGTYETIRQLAPGAVVLKGLPIEMQEAEKNPASAVKKWLAEIYDQNRRIQNEKH